MKRFIQLLTLLIYLVSCNVGRAQGCDSSIDVVVLGDSNIWLGGDNCDNERGWTCHLASLMQPNSIHSYARSGATWTNTTSTRPDTESYTEILNDNNVIYNQVLRLQKAFAEGTQPTPELILIAAGGNDAWFHNKRPGIFEQEAIPYPEIPTSLQGSVCKNCELLQKSFPDARIVLIAPHQMTKGNPEDLTRVCEIIECAGKDMGVDVIRLDLYGPINRQQESAGFVNTYDGVHTSLAGARKTAQFIWQQLDCKPDS